MRGAALERVLIGQKISIGDIDKRVERVSKFYIYGISVSAPTLIS